jgi:hypothetical protein
MQFKDICSILEDVQLDQLEEGVKIVQLVNTVLIQHSESISITDTGLTLIGKYHIWSDELKLKVNEIAFSTSIDFISLVKEVKQHKYAIEAQRDSDYNTKSQLVVIICIILLVTIGFKTQSVYEKVEAVTPQTNKEILGVVEKAAKPTEP